MMNAQAKLLSACFVACLAGCGFVTFEDVSSLEPYSAYVGKQFRSTQTTLIYRVSMDQNYKPDPSVYIVEVPPGFRGPEVLSRAELPANSTFTVLKVMRCKDCYLDFGERVHLVVQFTSPAAYNDREVEVSDKLLGNAFVEVGI